MPAVAPTTSCRSLGRSVPYADITQPLVERQVGRQTNHVDGARRHAREYRQQLSERMGIPPTLLLKLGGRRLIAGCRIHGALQKKNVCSIL